jgi:PAS domain S-box-containing protein
LVEKEKRKARCGRKRPHFENFVFHLKLEEQKKKKRKSNPPTSFVDDKPMSFPVNTYGLPYSNQQLYTTSNVDLVGLASPSWCTQVAMPPLPTENISFSRQLSEPNPSFIPVQQESPTLPIIQTQFTAPQDNGSLLPSPSESSKTAEQKSQENSLVLSVIAALNQVNANIPTVVTVIDGCIIKANEAMCKLLGYSSSEMQTLMMPNLICCEDKSKHNVKLLHMLAADAPVSNHHVRMIDSKGYIINVVKEVCCIRNDSGVPQWIITRITSFERTNEYIDMNERELVHCICDHNKSSREKLLYNDASMPFHGMV